MRYYMLSEVMHELHINSHRLDHLLEICSIDKKTLSHDRRRRLISEDEFIRVRQQHLSELSDLGELVPDADEVATLRAKVAALEAALARQTRQDDRHALPTGESALPPTSDTTAPTARHYSAVQPGYQYDEHGVMAKGSVGRLIALHSEYNEDYGRKFLAGKISEDQRMSVEGVLTWLRNYLSHVGRAGDWHTCTDDACPCDAV